MAVGVLTAVTRRHVQVYCSSEGMFDALLGSRNLEACVGDQVRWSESNSERAVDEILPRKNCLRRSYDGKTKRLAANADILLIVAAPPPLLNTAVIDRMLASARIENIPVTLVYNKSDLDPSGSHADAFTSVYKRAEAATLRTSALEGCGLEELKKMLNRRELLIAAIAGVSGVGKSTLLNSLIPDSDVRTAAVSSRTGQGKQTTSQSIGHFFPREDKDPLLLIDLPGVQQFGVSHLSDQEVRSAFPEFTALDSSCRFSNCWHLSEPDCAVCEARTQGIIPAERYDSYRSMLEEVRSQSRF